MEQVIVWIKERTFVCISVVLLILCVLFFSLWIMNANATEAFTCPREEIAYENSEPQKIVVDIKGAVVNPGVYYVNADTIVQEVIVLAGGLTKEADTSNLNLSKKVSNEMVITVYTKEEIKENKKLDAILEDSQDGHVSNAKISLNNASIEELTTLSGIGEEKAKLIIQYRDKCGPFKSIEEVKNIKGIGQAMYEKIKDYITV